MTAELNLVIRYKQYIQDNFLKPMIFKALVDYADDFKEVKIFWKMV